MSEPVHPRPALRLRIGVLGAVLAVVALVVAACGGSGASPTPTGPSVVVTTPVLGAVVRDLVGDRAAVTVLMGNGVDPHDWSPSAKDIERVTNADLVVANGLGLEEGLERTLEEAEKAGVAVFDATDHISVREADEGGEADVADLGADLDGRLADLDAEIRETLAVVPEASRKLVTGHESMGYFADRYGFSLVGTVIPGLSSQGEVSAGELAKLKAAIEAEGVPAIFVEIGTPTAVAEAIGRETGVAVVELPSHTIPADGSYFTFVREIAAGVADALR